LGRRYL